MRRVIDSIRIDFVEVTIDEIPGDPGTTRFEVYCGDRYEDELAGDEALWVVAHFLTKRRPSGNALPYLRTAAQNAEREARLTQMRATNDRNSPVAPPPPSEPPPDVQIDRTGPA